MLYTIAGVVSIVLAIAGLVYTFVNKNDMPITIHGYRREKSEVTDLEKVNRIMVIENVCTAIWLLLSGTFCMLIKEPISFTFISFVIFINLFFSVKVKKYVK